jgi:serine phosphatase RsbU (regulator of sigma subunit)
MTQTGETLATQGAHTGRAPTVGATAALEALAAAAIKLADGAALDETLAAIVDAAAAATSARLAGLWLLDTRGTASTRVVSAVSSALAGEVEGTVLAREDLPVEQTAELARTPREIRRIAKRAGTAAVLRTPVVAGGRTVGSLELVRAAAFEPVDRAFAQLAVAQVAIALQAPDAPTTGPERPVSGLELASHALAAGADQARAAEHLARLAAEATGAVSCLLWRSSDGADPTLAASFATPAGVIELNRAQALATRALARRSSGTLEPLPEGLPGGARYAAMLQLGRPPLGVLQLFFAAERPPPGEDLEALADFAVRAANLLRASERVTVQSSELERAQALLGVLGQAISELSLAHALETTIDRVADLLGADRLAVYLLERDRLLAAAERGVTGPHTAVAERLLELSLGRFRARGFFLVDDLDSHRGLATVAGAAAEAGIEAALAVPLLAHEEVIGLLAVYFPSGRSLGEGVQVVRTLADQLAVAVQNARLHEQAKELVAQREQALEAERTAAEQLRSLYEISRSFTHSLSLDTTLQAIAQATVELLHADAAVIRMPDERREVLEPRAVYVAEARLEQALQPILLQPQPVEKLPGRRKLRAGRPFVLDAGIAARLGTAYEVLSPFLAHGSTAAVLPIATPGEMLGTLTLLSLDPSRPLREDTLDAALSVAGQAALALENARLYQQQKDFADTMQRSLLPRDRPDVQGLEVGVAYESSARLDVGGDVYDFATLRDGRLAVVLGDVTGHGLEAAAEMAMAKFVFRSLSREHSEAGDFLAHANEVVAGEIAPGKFLTLVYLLFEAGGQRFSCAVAGHPPPRLVRRDGSVEALIVAGLALGIERRQRYEEVAAPLERGSAVVLYTDGVIEARDADGDMYGVERLDAVLAEQNDLPAEQLARAVVDDSRAFGGEPTDDSAVIVVKRV